MKIKVLAGFLAFAILVASTTTSVFANPKSPSRTTPVRNTRACKTAMGDGAETLNLEDRARLRRERTTLSLIVNDLILAPTSGFQGGGSEKIPESHVGTLRELGGGQRYSSPNLKKFPALAELSQIFQNVISLTPEWNARALLAFLHRTIPSFDSAHTGLGSELDALPTSAAKVERIMEVLCTWDAGSYVLLRSLAIQVVERLKILGETPVVGEDLAVMRERIDFLNLRSRLTYLFIEAQQRAYPWMEAQSRPKPFESTRLEILRSLKMPLPEGDVFHQDYQAALRQHRWITPAIRAELRFVPNSNILRANVSQRKERDDGEWRPFFLSQTDISSPAGKLDRAIAFSYAGSSERYFWDPLGRIWRFGHRTDEFGSRTEEYSLRLVEGKVSKKEISITDFNAEVVEQSTAKLHGEKIRAAKRRGWRFAYAEISSSADDHQHVLSLHHRPFSLDEGTVDIAWSLIWDGERKTFTVRPALSPTASIMSDFHESSGGVFGSLFFSQKNRGSSAEFRMFPSGADAEHFSSHVPYAPNGGLMPMSFSYSDDLRHFVRVSVEALGARPALMEYFEDPKEDESDDPIVGRVKPIATLEGNTPASWMRKPVLSSKGDIFLTLPELDGSRPIFADHDKVRLYGIDRQNRKIVKLQEIELENPYDIVLDAAFSADGQSVAILLSSGTTHIYRVIHGP